MEARSGNSLDRYADALRERLIERARAGSFDASGEPAAQVVEFVEHEAWALEPELRRELAERVTRQTVGLGPLEDLLADPDVDEVMVNGAQDVWIERHGKLERTGVEFGSDAELEHAIERILAPLGRRVDQASPLCDARMPDGSRVNVVIPPLSLDGPTLTVRRFRRAGFSAEELVNRGTLSARAAAFLAQCVEHRVSILVSGGTGSGKTTTLNALSAFIPERERIVTIEDAAELKLRQCHTVRLEARPPNVEGRGEVTIRMLLKNALRMRPDRIIVGEVRGGEALDMLAAMTTGHDGSLATVHASDPCQALTRVETLALMGGVEIPHAAVRIEVASAIELVVHQGRRPDGGRQVTEIIELVSCADGYETHVVYRAEHGGSTEWSQPKSARLRAALDAAAVMP